MALLQFVMLSAMLLQSCWAKPAYPGSHGGFYNGAFNNGAYNGAYNAAFNNGAYNGVYNGVYNGGANFDTHPRYNFDYRVAEPRTGDYKNHQESRDGDAVRGSYSVAEPDGSLLTVRYAADDAHGYTAVVERSGAGGTFVQNFPGPAPLPVGVAPIAPVAPLAAPLAAPIAAPIPGVYGHAGVAHHGGVAPFAASRAPFAYGGHGTATTTFNGPHAAYSYGN